jgi:zinc D-Ala-D-Ala carboxypeptidase
VTRLTQHFTLEEITRSDYAVRQGLDNTPPPALMGNALPLAEGLERVRAVLGVPVFISSGYRSPAVNRGVGGAASSQHLKFQAADVSPFGLDLRTAMEKLIDHEDFVRFDQLIYEGQWLHVSFAPTPRGSILVANFGGGGVTYSKWG